MRTSTSASDVAVDVFNGVVSQVESSASADAVGADRKRKALSRLPGLCGRLKRRRVTILCNLQKFCWPGRSRGRSQSAGQVCRCPRGSRCSHFFVHSP
uniref:Cocaine- and amphetamine-regulated transcript protein n=1 Tax=Mola mola TaxID=94237 RepID=A0A3Q3XBL5_MOLML